MTENTEPPVARSRRRQQLTAIDTKRAWREIRGGEKPSALAQRMGVPRAAFYRVLRTHKAR